MKNGTQLSGAAARQLREKYDQMRMEKETLEHENEYYKAEEYTKAHALKAKFDKRREELDNRLEETEAERDKYKALYYGLLKCSPLPSRKSASSPRAKYDVDVKGYLRPTESSKARKEAVKSQKSMPAPRKRVPARQDKTCPTCGLNSDQEYQAWLAATLPAVRTASPVMDTKDEWTTPTWSYVEKCYCEEKRCGQSPCVQKWATPTQYTCNVCTRFDSARYETYSKTPAELENDICQRTRLQDSAFWDTPASRVSIPYNTQVRLLHAALRLAKDTLWHATRTYWPEFQRKHYPHGPNQVKFGYKETKDLFVDHEYLNKYNNLCGMPPWTVYNVIRGMNHLRNAIAHPEYLLPSRVDELLKSAQELACALFDESRATQIRRLRDQLRQAAEKSLEEIINFEPLSHLPGTRRWALHHQDLFDQVAKEMRGSQSHLVRITVSHLYRPSDVPVDSWYHPSVINAAVGWVARFQLPGSHLQLQWHWPDMEPNVDWAGDEAINFVRSGGRDKEGKDIKMKGNLE